VLQKKICTLKLHLVGKDNVKQLLYISVYLLSMQLIPRVNIKKKKKKKKKKKNK